jgi:hypothetical protein
MENSKSNSLVKEDKNGLLTEKLAVFALLLPNNSIISPKYGSKGG